MTEIKNNSKNIHHADCVIFIHPNRNWLAINWREIWDYKDLLFLLVRRDFVAKYKQTILGPLWHILQPLATTVVFTIIFHRVAKIPTDQIPPVLFYLCGLLGWTYFANCLNYTSTTFVANASIFNKVYFPRLIIPFSIVISRFLTFVIQLAMFLCFYIYFKLFNASGCVFHINAYILILFPILILMTALLGLGVGLWLASLTAKYRDLTQLITFLTSLWMYSSPVIYPLSLLPPQGARLMAFNPMAGIIEGYRFCFFNTAIQDLPYYLLISAILTAIILISGMFLFNKVGRTVIDTI